MILLELRDDSVLIKDLNFKKDKIINIIKNNQNVLFDYVLRCCAFKFRYDENNLYCITIIKYYIHSFLTNEDVIKYISFDAYYHNHIAILLKEI